MRDDSENIATYLGDLKDLFELHVRFHLNGNPYMHVASDYDWGQQVGKRTRFQKTDDEIEFWFSILWL